MDGNNHLSGFGYDASGNTTGDGVNTYTWDAESHLKVTASSTYIYDGDGRRVAKVGSKLYWYGSGDDILAETDASGNTTAEYIFFGGKRIAMIPWSGTPPVAGNPTYYVEDMLGTSRVLATSSGVVCYDADFYPYGGERSYTDTCPQNNYKFEGKERDTETGNDDFGARYYSNRFGRWLSADWSAVPAPVPYANLSNPQTLNLYSMVADDPESFADLDGHCWKGTQWACNFVQRVYYGVKGEGFKTHAQVTEIRKQRTAAQRKWLIDHNVVSTDQNGNTIDWSKASDKEVNDKAKQIVEEYQQYLYAIGMVAYSIAGGHAFDEHARPGQTRPEFRNDVEETMTEPSEVRVLPRGRKAFWNAKKEMVVISDPNHPDGGTAFYPSDGKAYFDGLGGWLQN